jgi:hypothetical protein
VSELNNRQLRALALNKLDGAMDREAWRAYGYSSSFIENLAGKGYLRLRDGDTTITMAGLKALEESR